MKMRIKKKTIKNSTPFLILLIMHFLLLMYTLYKKRHKSYLILLFTNIGFSYFFEYFVLNLFQGYRYKPKIFRNKYFDNILGAIFSQGMYVPITATALTAFRLGFGSKLLVAISYALIERLFISMKIFNKKWWKTYYTLIFIPISFMCSDICHRLLKHNHPVAQGVTSYLTITSINVSILYILALFGKIKFGLGIIHSWREHFIIVPGYSFILSAVLLITYKVNTRLSTYYRMIFVVIFDFVLYQKNVLKNKKTILILFPFHMLMCFISNKLFNMIYKVYPDDSENKETQLNKQQIQKS
ncbi:hypothetical protein [Metabacillus sp. Hm71]|uniref:hypothetical protein n=1 Tax=Metabacillus sp. Hm71 TaxID=3450743 RepID=UPI003F4426F2